MQSSLGAPWLFDMGSVVSGDLAAEELASQAGEPTIPFAAKESSSRNVAVPSSVRTRACFERSLGCSEL